MALFNRSAKITSYPLTAPIFSTMPPPPVDPQAWHRYGDAVLNLYGAAAGLAKDPRQPAAQGGEELGTQVEQALRDIAGLTDLRGWSHPAREASTGWALGMLTAARHPDPTTSPPLTHWTLVWHAPWLTAEHPLVASSTVWSWYAGHYLGRFGSTELGELGQHLLEHFRYALSVECTRRTS
jgi:hypothetical protein